MSRLLTSAREAEGKRASKSDMKEAQETQEFSLFYQREHAIAYMLRKMPYNYFVYKRLIKEIQMRVKSLQLSPTKSSFEDDEPNQISVLDYGAGLGSGLWAAIHCYGQENIFRVAAVEPNTNMRKLVKFMTEDLNKNGNILWVDSLAMIPGQGGERGKFDVVILGYVL